jgi:NAD(P)-dependent dehydrogenase (short-subunit alcohol dehydrogenase family)
MAILREDLLAGRAVVLSRARGAVREQLIALGAAVVESGGDAVVHDAGAAITGGDGLMNALEAAWTAVSQAANSSLIPSGQGGKVVLIAPAEGAGDEFVAAARAALENLARTLSIEWARYGVTAVAIAPAEGARDEDVALLTAYLLSSAGDYFSGCRFEIAPGGA